MFIGYLIKISASFEMYQRHEINIIICAVEDSNIYGIDLSENDCSWSKW